MRHLSAPFDRAHARRSTADVTKPTYEEGVMAHPTPPLHGAPDLGKRATSDQAALTPRRRRLAVRRAAKLRERYLPARLALAQDSPHDGKASADYVRTLDELWDIERRLEDAPASVDEPVSSTVQPGHLVTVEFKGRRRLLRRRGQAAGCAVPARATGRGTAGRGDCLSGVAVGAGRARTYGGGTRSGRRGGRALLRAHPGHGGCAGRVVTHDPGAGGILVSCIGRGRQRLRSIRCPGVNC